MENKKIKILAIDDNRDNLISLKAIISEEIPQTVVYVELSGQDGIESARKNDPDVILLDIVMPGMDGYQVCKTLKADEQLSETPVIFLTALKEDKQSRILALEAGGEAFLAKPIDATELKAQILAMLKIKEAASYKRDQRLHLEELVQKRTEELKGANIAALNLLEDLNNEIEIRKQSELELKKSEEIKNSMVSNISDVIVIIDKNGINQYKSPNITKIFGWKPEELVGKNTWDNVHPEDLEAAQKFLGVIATRPNATGTTEVRYKRKDGDYVWIEITVTNLFHDKNIQGILGSYSDISDRKRAEDKLRESEDSYKRLVGNIPEVIFTVDMEGKLTFVNQRIKEILDYERAEAINMNILNFIPAEDFQRAKEALQKGMKGEKVIYFQTPMISKSGKRLFCECSFSRIYKDGALIGAQGTASDITERKQAEEKIREKDIQFRKLSSNLPDLIYQFTRRPDGSYCVPIASEGIKNIFGCSPEDVLEDFTPIGRVIHPEDAERVINDIENSAKHLSYFTCEFRVQIPGRPVQWILSRSTPEKLPDGSVTWYGFNANITERKQAEEKLKLLNRAIEASSVAVEITDVEGNINYVNPFFTELTGYSYEEAQGKNPRFLKSGNHPKEFYKDLWDTILSGKEWTGEFQNRKKNGELYWEKAIISPILNSNGEVANFIAIKDDITERKKILRELVEAKEKAEESDTLKTAFLNNISHEIRTPLNGILGYGSLMAESELSEEERKEFFKHLEKSSYRLMNTVNDYMDMAMLVSNSMKVHEEEFVLEPILLTISEKKKQLCLDKNLKFEVAIPFETNGLTVNSDPELIQKIFEKLIDNSIKFTQEGSITIGYLIKTEHIEFFVKDTGSGIDDDKLDLIFEAFRQAETSMTRGYEGSGLGLTIAKGLVKLIGGEITVASEKGIGSEFTFNIPLNNPGKSISQNTTDTTKPKSTKKALILIAEDDELNYEYMAVLLKSSGHDYIHAVNGKEAVDFCRQNPEISVVLMDIKMPVMNGDEASRQIRTFRPELPIIATTAYAQTGEGHRFLEAGCNDYLPKPIKKEKLVALISKYVG